MKYDLTKCNRVLDVKGWSQSVVAKRAKVSDASVSNFFTGKRIRRATAKAIIEKGLQLKVSDVLVEQVA